MQFSELNISNFNLDRSSLLPRKTLIVINERILIIKVKILPICANDIFFKIKSQIRFEAGTIIIEDGENKNEELKMKATKLKGMGRYLQTVE